MNNNLKSTLVPKSHGTSADRAPDSRGMAPTLHVQTGIHAGAWDGQVGNDAARGFGAIGAVADFLADWFN